MSSRPGTAQDLDPRLLAGGPVAEQVLVDALARARAEGRRDLVWLVLALAQARLPFEDDVVEQDRRLRLDGPERTVAAVLDEAGDGPGERPALQVVADEVLVDVTHTVLSGLRTGIQRVVRETVSRWGAQHPLRLVAWRGDDTAMRLLTDAERVVALDPAADPEPADPYADPADAPELALPALVPWHSRFVLPELGAFEHRAARLRSMARFGVVDLSIIGYDLIPITHSESTVPHMPGNFAAYMGAVKRATAVAPISAAAATEFSGFCDMLSGQGLTGPRVQEVPLPAQAPPARPEDVEAAREALTAEPGSPLVLVVGTHEPRKNHLAVLHAAELLWRDGVRFSLALIGANGWEGREFAQRAAELQGAGRPLTVVKSAPERVLWGAYRAARVLLFPSLHEGFGLPVAEALACGTPAVTSDFGSMLELARDGGALTVDPHDDHALAAALRRLLEDDDLHARLVREAGERPVRTWDDYAADVWTVLVEGGTPAAPPPTEPPVGDRVRAAAATT